MNTKRFFAMFSMLMIISFVLTACAGVATTTVPVVQEPVTIRFQDWRLAEEPAATALKNLVNEFEASHPDIKVALEPVANKDRIDKFNNQFRAGDPPDVVRFNLTDIPTEVAMGALLPLGSYVENAGGQEFLDDFSKYMVDVATVDGEVYAIPHEGDALLLYVNKRLWE
jgi:multiple sugar transport system substrate-binding protein